MKTSFGKRAYLGDAVIIATLLALCLIPYALKNLTNNDETFFANVYFDGELAAVLPLNKDTEFSPDGGHTVVAVENGRAFIKSSDCPDGICMQMQGVESCEVKNTDKNISESSLHSHSSFFTFGNAVCIPNKVAVTASNSDSVSKNEKQDGLSADVSAG